MNRDAFDDDDIHSVSSDDIESNALAGDLCATENCALLLQDNEKSNDTILRRIAHYADRGRSRFQRNKFQNSGYADDNDSDNAVDVNQQKSSRFNTSLRQAHQKPVKRFLYVFGFASTLIILSQLYLLIYYDDRSVQGESGRFMRFFPHSISIFCRFYFHRYHLIR